MSRVKVAGSLSAIVSMLLLGSIISSRVHAETVTVSLRVNVSTSATPAIQDVSYRINMANTTLGSNRVLLDSPVQPSSTGSYHYATATAEFRGVNAFYHVDSMYRWLARVYPAVALPSPVTANVSAGSTLANPGPIISFGEDVPGRHAAVDPGMVAHEAGHALLFTNHIYAGQGAPVQFPGLLTQRPTESLGLHEGTATFFAAAYLGTPAIGAFGSIYTQRTDRPSTTHRMSLYDAVSCATQRQYCIGELWSSTLWDYYQAQGDSAISVILRSLKYWPNGVLTFESAGDALRAAASEVGGAQPAALASVLSAREIGFSAPATRTLGPLALPHQHGGWYLAAVDGGLPPYAHSWTVRVQMDEETTHSYSNLSGSPTPDSLRAVGATLGTSALTVIGTVTDQRGTSVIDSLQVEVFDGWPPPMTGIQVVSEDGNFTAAPSQLKRFTAPYNSYAGHYNNLPADWEYRKLDGPWVPLGTAKLLEFRFPVSYQLRAHRNGSTSPEPTILVSGGPSPAISATPPDYTCTTAIALSASATGGSPGYYFTWAAESDAGNVSLSQTTGSTSGFIASESTDFTDVTLTVVDSWGAQATVVRRVARVGVCTGGGGGEGGDPGDIYFGAGRKVLFSLPHEGFVAISLFDIAGREVAPLIRRRLSAGIHSVAVPRNLGHGRVLFAALRVDGRLVKSKRLLLME